jgi:hypothetical protein
LHISEKKGEDHIQIYLRRIAMAKKVEAKAAAKALAKKATKKAAKAVAKTKK